MNKPLSVFWTTEAENSYRANLEYLSENWPAEVFLEFIERTDEAVKLLSVHPYAGRFDEILKCNRFLVVEQISLFYSVEADYIVLITFWNNLRKPLTRLR